MKTLRVCITSCCLPLWNGSICLKPLGCEHQHPHEQMSLEIHLARTRNQVFVFPFSSFTHLPSLSRALLCVLFIFYQMRVPAPRDVRFYYSLLCICRSNRFLCFLLLSNECENEKGVSTTRKRRCARSKHRTLEGNLQRDWWEPASGALRVSIIEVAFAYGVQPRRHEREGIRSSPSEPGYWPKG